MAARQRLKALTGAAAAAAAAAPRGAKETTAADTPPKRDLNDTDTQQAILRPEPAVLTACGEAITLHPLPARLQRQLAGLAGQIIAEVAGKPGLFQMRLKGALAESYDLSRKFFSYVARATFTTDFDVTPEVVKQIDADAARYNDGVSYKEIGELFDRMMELNHILEAFSAPK